MSAYKSGSLSAVGSVTMIDKPLLDNEVIVSVDGTYGTVTLVFEGSINGTNWFPMAAIALGTGVLASGSIAPADNATLAWNVLNCEGMEQIRTRVTAIASGTINVKEQSAAVTPRPGR